jgi:hypothetical protein
MVLEPPCIDGRMHRWVGTPLMHFHFLLMDTLLFSANRTLIVSSQSTDMNVMVETVVFYHFCELTT